MSLRAEKPFPAGEVAELLAHLLDRMLGGLAPEGSEARPPSILLRDQLTGERAVADVLEHLLHRGLHVVVDEHLAASQVAVLGDVGDRMSHVREAALVDQVDDQLHLVDALVVGDLGLVAGLDERLEACLHEGADTSAEHRLLSEQVALGLLGEARPEHPGPAAADRGPVGESEVESIAACVLRDGDEARRARPRLEDLAHAMPGALGGDHDHVVAGAGRDLAEVHGEAMGEEHRGAGFEVGLDLALVDALLHVVGKEDRDELCALHSCGDGFHREPGFLRGAPRIAPETQPDLDLHAGVAQVERMGMALAAIADDGHFAVEQIEIAVAVDLCHDFLSLAENVLTPGGARRRGTGQADAARARKLLQAVRAHELLEGVELLRRADDLENDRVRPEVGDPRTEDLGEGEELAAPLRRRIDFEQGELALARLARLELVDAQDVHELVHLLLDLLERLLGTLDPERYARDVLTFRRAHREALYVEAAAGEHVRDARERAGAVLDQHGERVRHASTTSSSASNSMTSSAAAPAGIIGKHFSSGSTRASTTAVRPHVSASSSAGSRSSSDETVNPAAP